MKALPTISTAAFAAVLFSTSVSGGEITRKLKVFGANPPTTGINVTLDVDANVISLSPTASGWKFNFIDPAETVARMRLGLSAVPTGLDFAEYDLDLPFYSETRSLTLTALLIKEDTNDGHVQDVVDDLRGGAWLGDLSKTFEASQRLRRIFLARQDRIQNQGATPLRIDVSVAYWLIVSARELFEKRNIVPDDATLQAKEWLKQILAQNSPLIGTSSAPASDVQLAIDRIDEWEGVKYVRLLTNVEDGLRSSSASKRAAACSRAQSLWRKVRAMDDDEYARATRSGAVHLRSATNAALCLTWDAAARGLETLDGEDRDTATALFDDFNKLMPGASGPELENARGRMADLARYVPIQ